MIHIEKDQAVSGHDNLKVFSVSGDYSDEDLIDCYDIKVPSMATASFQAQYIKYGSIIYRFNEPEELGQALNDVDPQSTHDAVLLYKEERAREQKRKEGRLKPENPVPVDENLSEVAKENAAATVEDSKNNTPASPDKPAAQPSANASQTDSSVSDPSQSSGNELPQEDVSTSSQPSIIQEELPATETTTPDTLIDSPLPDSAASSTPVSLNTRKRKRLIV